MRFLLEFDTDTNEITLEYRRFVLSFIKRSLEQYEDGKYFTRFYNGAECIVKPYSFAVNLGKAIFNESFIFIEQKKIWVNFSVFDYEVAFIMCNAFTSQRNIKHPISQKGNITLTKITNINEKMINRDNIVIKMLSPLCVLDHNANAKSDYYYSFEHDRFYELLKDQVYKLANKFTNINKASEFYFDIKPIAPKKVIVKHYDQKIETSVGIFELKSNIHILDFLYKSGLGSKRSAGFGLFEIIG